ncbi:MAG: cell envelope protein SmpA [Cycloclasticus sp. symbiont of Poecilosclerida sp. M]|nr:MAG: cell envelope protein SmpA [Cycloclasticus sp. symbiont of Poecilosclerida sp. M]
MRTLLIIILVSVLTTLLTACSTAKTLNDEMQVLAENMPGVYKINVRQGNVVTQEMIDQLRPGMDKRQVKFLLGTPLLVDPFHKERWDYFYNLKKGGSQSTRERITVIFKDGELAGLKGDFRPSNEFKPMTINTEVVDVPRRVEDDKTIVDEALEAIGIEYDEKY